ncbi:MAG: cell division protein FtsA [Muribaculaceae bacterium]|nr:cell division protein FtsA [Muribaculaceae bacterium]
MEQKYIVAVEIGSSKVKGAVGTVDNNGTMTVRAIEEEPLIDCVRYGCIQNVEEVSNRVTRIIRKIENRVSPRKVRGIYVALGGRSLCSSAREIERQYSDEVEITERIVSQLKNEALATGFSDRDVVEVIPREFTVDNMSMSNPIGTFGQQISATLNLLSCKPQIKRNLNRVLNERLQFKVNGYIVRPVAVADLVLSDDEKRLGCMLVDFGAETTTVSIYKNGSLQYLVTVPLGSRNITRDITSLNFLEERAEEIKKAVGNANASVSGKRKPSADGIDTSEINGYVQARAGEIVANIMEQVNYAGLKAADLPGGIVVVGGGAKLKGFNALLETQSKLKVRSGAPSNMIPIADGRIQPNDSVDVIAILMAASRMNPVECMEMSVPITGGDDEPDDIYESDDTDDDPGQKVPKGPGLLERIKMRIEGLISEDDEEFDDDER